MKKTNRLPLHAAPERVEFILARKGEQRFANQSFPISMELWRAVLGPKIAQKCLPYSFKNGVLEILVPNSAWASELSFLELEIRNLFKENHIVLNKLKYRVGSVESPFFPPERRKFAKVPRPVPLSKELSEDLENIQDERLKETLKKAISINLAWQDMVNFPK